MLFLSAKWRLTWNSQQYSEMTKLSPKSLRMNSIIIQFTLLNFHLSNKHVRLLPNVTFSLFLEISTAHVQLRYWLGSAKIQARRRCSMITVPDLLWLVLFHLVRFYHGCELPWGMRTWALLLITSCQAPRQHKGRDGRTATHCLQLQRWHFI